MSSIVAFIPIKSVSKRVPGKNFRLFCGHPLYQYIITSAINSGAFDTICVDTDSDEIKEFAASKGAQIIDRPEYMTADSINGNDLLIYDYEEVKSGDYLFQLFATAPLMKAETIRECVEFLKNNQDYDSIFTATEETGWFWFNDLPVNFRPEILPRSQDAKHLVKESTGLYGITREALLKYACRTGARPKPFLISPEEALDIDTEHEFEFAQSVGYRLKVNELISPSS
jgi:CMP-N-acetylneuraminic acid synthetase